MPLYDKIIDDVLNRKDKELGTIGSETMSNIGSFVQDQYERIPEDKREGFEQGVSEVATGIQEWNKNRREVSPSRMGPLDPFILAGKAYNTVATPIKEQISKETGLAPSVIEAGEIGLDIAAPFIPLTVRKAEDVVNTIFSSSRRLKDWGKRTVGTTKGLIGEESIVANVGTGLDEAFTKLQGVNTLNPDGPILLAGKGKRTKVASGLVTGGKYVSERVFNKQGDKIRKIVEGFFPELKTPKFFRRNLRYHHTGPIKQFAQSVNGLTDEAAEWGGDYMAKRLGQNLGMSKEQMSVLPDEFHKRIHALFNKLVGEKYTLAEIERKLNLPKDWQSTYTLEQRIPIFNELVDATIESKEAIDTFWRSLANRKDLGKVNRREFINSSIEIAELDERLFAIGGKTSKKTATEIISEVLGRSNTALENAVNLVDNTSQQDALYKVYLNNQGEQALWEVLIDGESTSKVFKKYKIKVSDRKTVEKVIGEISLSDEAYKIMKRRRGQSEIKVINPSESGQDHL